MDSRRVVFTSLIAALAGIGFVATSAAQPAQPGTGTFSGYHQSYNAGRYAPDPSPLRGDYGRSASAPPVGYACTWSGSRNLARGDTAYQQGAYKDAVSEWKSAASKDCAVAAYKLGQLYFDGNQQVPADRSLGTAWLRVAAGSKTANSPYYGIASHGAETALTQPQHARYLADYAALVATLGLPTSR